MTDGMTNSRSMSHTLTNGRNMTKMAVMAPEDGWIREYWWRMASADQWLSQIKDCNGSSANNEWKLIISWWCQIKDWGFGRLNIVASPVKKMPSCRSLLAVLGVCNVTAGAGGGHRDKALDGCLATVQCGAKTDVQKCGLGFLKLWTQAFQNQKQWKVFLGFESVHTGFGQKCQNKMLHVVTLNIFSMWSRFAFLDLSAYTASFDVVRNFNVVAEQISYCGGEYLLTMVERNFSGAANHGPLPCSCCAVWCTFCTHISQDWDKNFF